MSAVKNNKKLAQLYERVFKGKSKRAIGKNPILLSVLLLVVAVGVYSISRSGAAGAPDLVVTAITTNPLSPTSGQAVTFSATIKNQGTDITPAGTVLGVVFNVDGQPVTWSNTYTQSLAVGASVTLTANTGNSGVATWTATTGPHTVTANVDDTNRIPFELNEGNNTFTRNLTIGNTGQIYLTPATSNVLINNNVSVNIRINPGTSVEGVEATLTYDATKLQFVSIDKTGSPFDTALGPQTGGAGVVKVAQGTLNGAVATDSLVAKVTFLALAGSGSSTPQVTGNAAHAGVYTNPTGGSATINFATPDTTPPAVTLTSPAAGANIFNTHTATATATDNVGVTKVEFYVDGVLVSTDTASPYSHPINTTVLANGNHTIQAKAYDAAGNVGSSAVVTANVKNIPEDINQDGSVTLLDFSLLASKFGQSGTTLGRSDINGDGTVNLLDFSLLAAKFGT